MTIRERIRHKVESFPRPLLDIHGLVEDDIHLGVLRIVCNELVREGRLLRIRKYVYAKADEFDFD